MNFPGAATNQYVLTGGGNATPDGATVQKAKHVNPVTREKNFVGIKIFDIHKIEDITSFTTQVEEAESFDHENLVKVHGYFTTGDQLWVVMSPPGTPIRSIIWSYFRQGLPANDVAYILSETLKVLHYAHERNATCENFGGGCVSLDDECRVKVGISSITQDMFRSSNAVMEPGFVADYGEGKDKATDILMFGFLALELFCGEIPNCDEFTLLVADDFGRKQEKLLRRKFMIFLACFPTRRRRMPAALAEVVAACLCRDAAARPTTNQLIKFRLFRKTCSSSKKLMEIINNNINN